jgi:diacylglycerol kinase (ATP)
MKTIAILNPRSNGGRTGREAKVIAEKIAGAVGPITLATTEGPMSAARIAASALAEGYDHIVAVGGDGTVSEVVNGFFHEGEPINPQAVLGVVMTGTGGDFRKTFGVASGVDDAIARLARAVPRRIDVGRVQFVDDQGKPRMRYFDNIASFGLSGEVVRSVNRAVVSKMIGGSFAFSWNSAMAMLRYRNKPVRLKVDSVFDGVINASTVAICNGRYFGGGMKMAPEAEPDDGLFDVVMITDTTAGDMLRSMKAIYSGDHLNDPKVRVVRGQTVIAAPVEETAGRAVYLDIDGEAPGRLPATFQILPRALTVRF